MGMPDLICRVVSREVVITDRFEAFHRWPDAPEEVAFLRNLHRHMFHVTVTINVTHSDRQVEFFEAKRTLASIIKQHYARVKTTWSCEQMAESLAMSMAHNGYMVSAVEVSEDGENAGRVEVLTTTRRSGQQITVERPLQPAVAPVVPYMHFKERRENPGVPIPGTETFSEDHDDELRKQIEKIDPLSDVIEDQNVPG